MVFVCFMCFFVFGACILALLTCCRLKDAKTELLQKTPKVRIPVVPVWHPQFWTGSVALRGSGSCRLVD